MKPLLLSIAMLLSTAGVGAAPAAGAVAFSGATLDGQRFDLAARRGRVVMVVLWRSACPVCIDKLPELRANARGWKDAPFDLVLVNLDASPADAERYDRARRILAPGEASVFSFWQGQAQMPGPWRSPERLPHTVIFDRQGAVAAQFEGRIPAEAWNQVADLLP